MITKGQTLFGNISGGELPRTVTTPYSKYRLMRKHPTIALARMLSVAPIIASDWAFESDDDVPNDVVRFVQDQLAPVREPVLESALFSNVDFGWAPFEKVYTARGGAQVLTKLKPLLQDITTILVTKDTGAFAGFKNGDVTLPLENSLNIPFRVEGTNWYGEALLENVVSVYDEWAEANKGAARYDKKMAGSHWVVYYPPGETPISDGTNRPNEDIAREILKALESSGAVAVPRMVKAYVDELNATGDDMLGWKIELLSDGGGKQPTFIERQRYLDVLFSRGLLMPERSFQEGQFGTKAEAGEHLDLAFTAMDLMHRYITRVLNWHVVNQILRLNYGTAMENKVRIVPAPIVDSRITFLKEVYRAFLTNPAGFIEEYGMIDTDALKDALGIPKSQEVAQAGEVEKPAVDASDPRGEPVKAVYKEATLDATKISGIVMNVAKGDMPRDAGLAQLKLVFNMTDEQAREVMGSAGVPTGA